MQRKLMLVTGASAGIGEAFAKAYARKGWDVVLTARREDRLQDLATHIEDTYRVDTIVLPQDLSVNGAVDTILGEITGLGRRVDGLINNAGFGLAGTYLTTSWEDQAQFLQLMLTAPLELAHKVVGPMAERKFGRIINVASLAGYAAGTQGHTLYGAVKAALIKFSESLAAETRGMDVMCTAVCPGFTYSEFHDVNGTRSQTETMPKWLWSEVEPVVDAAIRANERGQPVCVPGAVNKGLATLTRILPEPIGRAMARGQSSKFRKTD